MTQVHKMAPRASAHVAAEVDGVSKDRIVVTGGFFPSGTVLGQLDSGEYTQLNIADGATEAHIAKAVIYGHVDASTEAQPTLCHARVCALYADKLTWPEAITAEQKAAAVAELAKAQIVLR
ncbi:head decoration protein [Vibrio parahaemolyticus]